MNNRIYDIGDRVFHCTKESPEGVVLNAYYDLLNNKWQYDVTFGPETPSLRYYEHELSAHKIY